MPKGEGYSKEEFDRAAQKALDESPEVQKLLEQAHEEALELNEKLAPLVKESLEASAAVRACWEKYGNAITTPESNEELRLLEQRSHKAVQALAEFAYRKLGHKGAAYLDNLGSLSPSTPSLPRREL